MRRSSLALVMIGLLVGSTTTLALTRQSHSQREILACTNKMTGKVRLTVTGTCDLGQESESPVSDLWSLQPASPTNPTTAESTTTVALPRTKHVVDSDGKVLGVLTDTDGRDGYWIMSRSGRWRLSRVDHSVSGYLRPLNSTEGPLYSDAACSLPLIRPSAIGDDKNERAVVDVMRIVENQARTTIGGFRVSGARIMLPRIIYGFSYTTDNTLTCSALDASVITGEVPRQVYKSTPAQIPTWSGALSIEEK